jgi:Phage integrase, N-terminal SAM-like domain
MAEMSPLRRRMIEDMTVRNLSPATQRSYAHAVSKFSRFFGCRRSCSESCAGIGGWRDRSTGCFQAGTQITRCSRPRYMQPAARPARQPDWTSG